MFLALAFALRGVGLGAARLGRRLLLLLLTRRTPRDPPRGDRFVRKDISGTHRVVVVVAHQLFHPTAAVPPLPFAFALAVLVLEPFAFAFGSFLLEQSAAAFLPRAEDGLQPLFGFERHVVGRRSGRTC